MKKLRMMLAALGVLLVVALGLILAYSLPRNELVKIVGDDVKRIDVNGRLVDPKAAPASRDVFFINTENQQAHDVRVFRNEDTRFGFPWYFKFDSADIQARAQLLARDNKPVLVTYYGWRIPMLSLFPNAVNVQPWDSQDMPFPVFNTIFFVILALLVITVWWKWRRFRQRRAARRAEQTALQE
jgi:hypothetical protein